MKQQLVKHRLEREVFEIDFTKRLDSSETISAPTILIERAGDVQDRWYDVTSDVFESTVMNGTKAVQLTVKAATTSASQPGGDYRVTISVNSSLNRHVVAVVEMRIDGEAPGAQPPVLDYPSALAELEASVDTALATKLDKTSAVDVLFSAGVGVILTAPDGSKHRLVVDNAGTLTTVLVP
jgi:hypothetical protein